MKIILLVVMLLAGGTVNAFDGHWLLNGWKEVEKYRADSEDVDSVLLAGYAGFVCGVTDTMRGRIAIPNRTSGEQLTVIVGRYVDAHPDRWSEKAVFLVIDALIDAFGLRSVVHDDFDPDAWLLERAKSEI